MTRRSFFLRAAGIVAAVVLPAAPRVFRPVIMNGKVTTNAKYASCIIGPPAASGTVPMTRLDFSAVNLKTGILNVRGLGMKGRMLS